jgi:hypothetical protein
MGLSFVLQSERIGAALVEDGRAMRSRLPSHPQNFPEENLAAIGSWQSHRDGRDRP